MPRSSLRWRGAASGCARCRSPCASGRPAAPSTPSASRSTTPTRTCWPRSWRGSSAPFDPHLRKAPVEFISRTQIIVALAAVGLAVFVLELVRRRRLGEEFSVLWMAASVVIAALGFSTPLLRLRAFRWRWLLSTPRPVSLDSLYSATMIGFMANNLFPLRVGEFVRAWALGRRENLSKTTVFATVVVERVVDMITLLAIFGVALLLHPISASTEAGRLTSAGAGLLALSCVGRSAFLVVIERSPRLLGILVDKITRPLPERFGRRAVQALQQFVEGLGLFRDLPRLLWVFLLSFVMFLAFAMGLQVGMWALG